MIKWFGELREKLRVNDPMVVGRRSVWVASILASTFLAFAKAHFDPPLLVLDTRGLHDSFRRRESKRIQVEMEIGMAYLRHKEKENGWVKHPSGLLFHISDRGPSDGHRPALTDRCSVHYKGNVSVDQRNPDHLTFDDSSYNGGNPCVFIVDEVITGWTIALRMMRPGDKWSVSC